MKHELCKMTDVPVEGAKTVEFFGRQALVYRHGGDVRAALSVCVHLGGPLELRGDQLVCPWHGASFDSGTGACTHGPARGDAKAMLLPTRIEEGALHYVWGE